MLLSDAIAQMIEEMINRSEGSAEFRRNDLAEQMGCVPSQINYVITSRFTPERGYIIESRRGGGGYVRIIRRQMHKNQYLMHVLQSIGSAMDEPSALVYLRNLSDHELLTARETAILHGVLCCVSNNEERADMMRQIILAVME